MNGKSETQSTVSFHKTNNYKKSYIKLKTQKRKQTMKTISKTMETLMKYQKPRAAAMSPEEEEVETDVEHGNNDNDDVHLIRRTSQGFDYCCNDDDLIPLNLEEADDDFEKLVDIFNECGDDFSYLLTNTATTAASSDSDSNNNKSNTNLSSPYTFFDSQINPRKRKRATTTTTSTPSTRQKLLFQNDESRRNVVKNTRRE